MQTQHKIELDQRDSQPGAVVSNPISVRLAHAAGVCVMPVHSQSWATCPTGHDAAAELCVPGAAITVC